VVPHEPGAPADVCLVLEGTYPYVQGGVSSWVHDLICGLPELKFGLVHIGAERGASQRRRYRLPGNVVYLRDLYCRAGVPPGGTSTVVRHAHAARARHREAGRGSRLLGAFGRLQLDPVVDRALLDDLASGDLSVAALLHGRAAFELTQALYHQLAPDASFLDFFWHVRSMYLPLVRLLDEPPPVAGRYHALCTGYAGVLAAVWSHRTGRPMILTEHGIYVRERALELCRATWFQHCASRLGVTRSLLGAPTAEAVHALWLQFFRVLARCAYFQSHAIISLSEGHRLRQILEGAPVDKTRVVPNGIDADALRARLGELRPRRASGAPVRVGFVGRVVPIKDAVTFLRACALALRSVDLEVRIIGPTDEDPAYAERCRDLAAELGLGAAVRFEGPQPIERIYAKLDIVVLTSFTEGQPLVILEASAAGLPVIASDVGACRELLEGVGERDRQLGRSGVITRLAAPEETAAAMIQLAQDPALRASMGAAGQCRVATFYRQSATIASYRSLYDGKGQSWPESAGAWSA